MTDYTYILQSVVGREPPTTVTCFSYENLIEMMEKNINDMKGLGYRLVHQTRTTFAKKFMTNVTLYYQKV